MSIDVDSCDNACEHGQYCELPVSKHERTGEHQAYVEPEDQLHEWADRGRCVPTEVGP